jgi:F-type H+-transporting ATPase subunit gamma
MIEERERAQIRLAHIRTVKPILNALRTISLGSWRMALNRSKNVRRYGEQVTAILPLVASHLPAKGRTRLAEELVGDHFLPPKGGEERRGLFRQFVSLKRNSVPPVGGDEGEKRRVVILVVGSERGLCGGFNVAVVERAEQHLADQEAAGAQVELAVLGTRVQRIFRRRKRAPDWSGQLSVAGLPSSALAFDLTRQWLARYEEGELDAVDLVYNAYRGLGRYESTATRLIPPRFPELDNVSDEAWPPPIIETDPSSLYARAVEQWAAVSLYGLLLDSATAEHSARYQLMEAASQNADRLIEELTLTIQTARQQEITREMQELTVGAGLIGPRDRADA